MVSFFPDYLLAALVDKSKREVLHSEVSRGRRMRADGDGVSIDGSALSSPAPSTYDLAYRSEGLEADLSLVSSKTPLRVGGRGKIREGLLGSSWYYAFTRLRAGGELRIGKRTVRTAGIAWMDRQWGRWDDMGIGGWEWFSLQFSNDWEVLATQIYSPVTMKTCVRVMSVKMPDSSESHTSEFTFHRSSLWRSPSTGTTYGNGWRLRGPRGLAIDVRADVDAQELHGGLWEGSCSATLDTGSEKAQGVGYAEQVVRNEGRFTSVLSLSAAPVHYLMQNALGRANLGVWDLLKKLGVWSLAPSRD